MKYERFLIFPECYGNQGLEETFQISTEWGDYGPFVGAAQKD